MPKRPKPHRISTLTTAAFGGWTIIRDAVLQQFGPTCKDTQYISFLHLLDEVLPLVFYFYCTVFRGGDYSEWLDATFRMALTFITFKRRNYDKATLCQLSDILFHAAENRDLVENIRLFLNAFTEKKVEVFHSVLRRFVYNKLIITCKMKLADKIEGIGHNHLMVGPFLILLKSYLCVLFIQIVF